MNKISKEEQGQWNSTKDWLVFEDFLHLKDLYYQVEFRSTIQLHVFTIKISV